MHVYDPFCKSTHIILHYIAMAMYIHVCNFNLLSYNEIIGTTQACSIVAGAAALVLEEHPEYSPAKVKRHLIKKAIDGIINMDSVSGDKGANKLLYIGEGSYKKCMHTFSHHLFPHIQTHNHISITHAHINIATHMYKHSYVQTHVHA